MDVLMGITFRNCCKLLSNNQLNISPRYFKRVIDLIVKSSINSFYALKEQRLYSEKLEKTKIETAPIFILGHWRSGTTLLHTLMTLDNQFSFPNKFQVSNPHTFLVVEPIFLNFLKKKKLEAINRPMDNLKVNYDSPEEDEFALAMASLKSPLIGWVFPKRQDFYDRYLTFEGVDEAEINYWKNIFLWFLKKVSFRTKRRLILKSPTHTCKIKILLDMFPDALFIHIHRNPYDVFQSTQLLYNKSVSKSFLQKVSIDLISQGILNRYAKMYSKFFEEKELIPPRQFFELSFNDLEIDPIGQLNNIYNYFQISDFENLLPLLKNYVRLNTGYKKNQYSLMNDDSKSIVFSNWSKYFRKWDYNSEASF